MIPGQSHNGSKMGYLLTTRRVVQELTEEYRACESPDYVNYD